MLTKEELYRYYLTLAEFGKGIYTEQVCNIHLNHPPHLIKWWITSTYF